MLKASPSGHSQTAGSCSHGTSQHLPITALVHLLLTSLDLDMHHQLRINEHRSGAPQGRDEVASVIITVEPHSDEPALPKQDASRPEQERSWWARPMGLLATFGRPHASIDEPGTDQRGTQRSLGLPSYR